MPGVFYDPKVFAWGDAIGEGINAYLAGKDIQLKDLQRKKLYEDLAKEAEIKKGLTGITANQAAGRYAPTVSTTRGRQLTQESPTYDPMGLSSGAVALPTETVQQTTTVPPQRSMLTDLKNMYMKTGNIEKAVQIGQMEKIENELNTSKYTKLWELLDHTGTAAKNLNLEPESLIREIIAPMLKNSGDPMLSGLDFSKITIKKTEDMDTVIKNIYGKNGRELPLDFKVKFKADGTHEIQIEPKAEKTEVETWGPEKPGKGGTTIQVSNRGQIKTVYKPLTKKEETTGTWTYVGTDEVSGKSILLNSKTGEQRLGERKVGPKPKGKSNVLKDLGLVGEIIPPPGFVDSGKTSGGKKVFIKGNQAWIAP